MIIEINFLSKSCTLLGINLSQGMMQRGDSDMKPYWKVSIGAVFITLDFIYAKGGI